MTEQILDIVIKNAIQTYLWSSLVWLPALWWTMRRWRAEALLLSQELVASHKELAAYRKHAPMNRDQNFNVQRELQRQKKKHENHEMVRRSPFGRAKKGRK
jgi:hypothetical protein